MEYLIVKGAKLNNEYDDHQNTSLMMCMEQGNARAMNLLLKHGFKDIYHKNIASLTALGLMTKLNRVEMIVQFCQYILINNDQFDGEIKVCQHIIDTGVAKVIMGLDEKNVTRKHFCQMFQKHQLKF